MIKHFVRVICDVDCSWTGEPPRYRAFVNGELFTERTWIWQDAGLEEAFQIEAPVGKYTIKYELVDTKNAAIIAHKFRVDHGPATITPWGDLEIHNENA